MKKATNYKFTNACIICEDGVFTIEETSKDEVKVYNLTEKLEEFIGVEGISLQISKTEELPSEE
ncbi:hypothetical protein [Clostridium cuniculi]|uniref:hypothetical protein n=1 Tax=Clostridium cuniculi TaxID=2548455 RepID=UPI0010554BBE|nr:hypothetical protein [Clostridium cuniculi]